MNKLVRGLLSGASLVTLQLCAVTAARAAGTTITGSHGAITNPAGSTQDYIFVTGATITGDLTNEGTVGPGASFGIDVVNSTITGAVINAATGVIHVTGTGFPAGIIVQSNASVAGGIQNAGQILVSNTSGTEGNESAKAIFYGSDSVAHVANSGTIGVDVSVVGTGVTQAAARAQGVWEFVDSGSAVDELFTGTGGAINLTANAAASSSESVQVNANAETGVKQGGFGGPAVAQAITNSGSLSLKATAKGTATTSNANVHARAMDALLQVGGDGSGWVNQQVANSGSIKLVATATANAAYSAYASAKASAAVYQDAFSGTKVAQLITNSGALTLSAKANATAATESATARAFARDALHQYVDDFSGNVNQAVTNSGAMLLSATAAAKGSSEVKAFASAALAIHQQAYYAGGSITQKITNSGGLSLSAKAKATAKDGSATAKASAGGAIGQYAIDPTTITQGISNTGDVTLLAAATANGHTSAKARASVGGVLWQDAYYSDTISQSITNSGGFSLTANAKATGVTSHADVKANASASYVFTQYAYNSGTPSETSSITQSISNSGDVSIALTATANRNTNTPHESCCSVVRAEVSANKIFDQNAYNAATLSQSITNSGALAITGNAKAVSDGIKTFGDANLEDLFNQHAGTAATITQSIMNSGPVSAAMTAVATGVKAKAFARAERLFDQYAYDATSISQTLDNSGNFSVVMTASAVGALKVHATAALEAFALQRASDAGAITQSITNSATLNVDLTAKVKNTVSDFARAYARAEGFKQDADGFGTMDQTVTNSGTVALNLTASIVSAATSRRAEATARMYTAIKQHAVWTGTSEEGPGQITQGVTNSGTLQLIGSADAKGGRTAEAGAVGGVFVKQYARNAGDISESVTNSGSILVKETAHAQGGTEGSSAYAEQYDFIKQYSDQAGNPDDTAALSAVNSTVVSATMNASAVGVGTQKAYADARVGEFASQSMRDAATGTETVTNSGSIDVVDNATATGTRSARAYSNSYGLMDQEMERVADGTISAVNSGPITAHNVAKATATQYATAKAGAFAGYQSLSRDGLEGDMSGSMSITNSGTIDLQATATAKGGLNLEANAYVGGFDQGLRYMGGTAAFDNSATIKLAAVATGLPGALGDGVTATTTRIPFVGARATGLDVWAEGSSGVFHNNGSTTTRTNSAPLTVAINNSGTLSVSATANGAALAAANIFATATGIGVYASSKTGHTRVASGSWPNYHATTTNYYGAGTVKGAIENSGSLLVSASADGGIADAKGIYVEANTIDADVTNAHGGLISVGASGATAAAVGISLGGAASVQHRYSNNASGTTVGQRFQTDIYGSTSLHGAATTVTGNVTNSGTISVSATGNGDNIGNGDIHGPVIAFLSESANKARAEGIVVNAETMSGTILNAGLIDVSASGPAAVANGIHVLASQTGYRSVETETWKWRASQSAFQWTTVTVTTPIHTAVLPGSKFTGQVSNTGTVSVSAKGTGSKATGVLIEDETFDGSFVNTGNIVVVGSGSGASATGVMINASSLGAGASFQNNNGKISATLNGGWGTAIDVSGAPSALILALNGGSIFGNVVENAAGNAVTIGGGNLLLDGNINPSHAKIGSLVVGQFGTLTLANNIALGTASAYVNTFTQPGTLAIVGGGDGSSGSIHAASATISGPAVVDLDLAHGIFGDTTTYRVVFSDAALSGTWSNVSTANAATFFNAVGVYSTNEADITVTRTPFDEIDGLTDNEEEVADAIETIYDTFGTSGPLGKLLGALFGLSPDQYTDALESLSGIPIGELLAVDQATAQSFLDAINNHLADLGEGDGGMASISQSSQVLAANIAPSNVTPAQATDMSGTNVWGGGFQSGNSVDRTASGPAYDSHNNGLLAGIDVPVSRNFLFGVAGSWSTGDIQVEHMLGFGTFKALQAAGYARYVADNGIYAQGDVSYGDFTNRLDRFISIPGFGSGSVHGKFDSTAWGVYGEAGWKFDPSEWAMSLTPYAAFSYLDAKSDGFTETGFGAPLVV
ncbi:MAG TPA: hypothetical protein VLT91_03135, partial [Rhizomicrobium sp.]|nr:hypothetical protein [Rhizomicrobium sp.]